MSFDNVETLRFTPSDPTKVGVLFISVRVFLTNYPNVTPFDTEMRVTIQPSVYKRQL